MGSRAIRPTSYPGRVLSCGPSVLAAPGSNVKAWAGRSCPFQSPWWARAGTPQSRAPGCSHSGRGRGGRSRPGRVGAGGTAQSERRRVERGPARRGRRRGRDGAAAGARWADTGSEPLGSALAGSFHESVPVAPPTAPRAPHAAPCGGGDAPRWLLSPPRGQP